MMAMIAKAITGVDWRVQQHIFPLVVVSIHRDEKTDASKNMKRAGMIIDSERSH
jgi:hypothetical protein